jgi:putative adhesin
MKGTKVALLILILGFGGSVETAWMVRNHISMGGGGCRHHGRFSGPSFSFEESGRHAVTAGATLEVENAFGAVRVRAGSPGEALVTFRKVVFRPTEQEAREYAGRIRQDLVAGPSLLRLGTNRRELEGPRPEVGFETHLDITVPADVHVKVVNRHGPVEVAGVADADVNNSHDAVRVERAAGPVRIRSSHGDVRVEAVQGILELDSQHGAVVLRDVGGAATVEMRHGDLEAARLGGLTLTIAHGQANVQDVRGDLEVNGQHAELAVAEVAGRARLETSHRNVVLDRVGGGARVRTSHGDVQATDVKGSLEVEASYDDVTVARVGGPLQVTVTQGGVDASSLQQGARIRATGENVDVRDFRGVVEIDVERGGAHLAPGAPLLEALKVSTRHGDIELELPPDSRLDLQASARHGEVTADAPALTVTRAEHSRIEARAGGGGNPVVLAAEQGDVRIRSGIRAAIASPAGAPASPARSPAPSSAIAPPAH